MFVVCIAVVVFECMQQSAKFKRGWRPGMWQTGAKGNELWVTACALICVYVRVFLCVRTPQAQGLSGKQRHVTFDKGEMRGNDWHVFWCHGLWAVLIRNSHTLLIHFNSLLSTALPIPSVVYSSLCPLAFLSVCVWLISCMWEFFCLQSPLVL